MRVNSLFGGISSIFVLALLVSPSWGQILYSQDFQTDDTANWTTNENVDTDEFFDYFFDYGRATTFGDAAIPAAPNSDPGETTNYGLRLGVNLISGVFGGFSVSPTGESFTGDYKLSFDMWANYIGATAGGVLPGGPGSTNLNYGGIMSSGTFTNFPGASDGVSFAYTGDGDSGADYRVYSSDRDVSYQLPVAEPNDADATYAAVSRDHFVGRDVYYNLNDEQTPGSGIGVVEVPAAQTTLYPTTQFGNVRAGAAGFAWRENEIKKIGDTVTWTVDGVLLATLDTSNFTIPVGGDNIFFGRSDTNGGVSLETNAVATLFTMIDNIVVEAVSAGLAGDYDGSGTVDAADYTVWLDNLGATEDGSILGGNGNGGTVDSTDYDLWKASFGNTIGVGTGGSGGAVPEPSSLMIVLIGVTCLAGRRSRS